MENLLAQEEEIIIKCPLEEMAKSFFQDYVILWHDPHVNSQENLQYMIQLQKLCKIFTFTEWSKARDYLQTTHTTCHVITSGTNGELLIKEINQNKSVANIYVFCGNKEYHSSWVKNYPKVSLVETDIQKVFSQIQLDLSAWYQQTSSLKLNLPAFAPVFNDSDKSQINHLHLFLRVIPNWKNRTQAKNDFVSLSKSIYSDAKNKQLIADFEQNYNEYNKEEILRWYTRESFLYKVTNNCLRIATSDSIQYCRLLLKDIEQAIQEHYLLKSKNFHGLLHRGAYLSEKEWESLQININREIEMHCFLSASKKKNIALNFLTTDPSKKVLITIILPKGPNEEEQGFAEMEEFSEFPQEKEILFNVRSRFTILETEDEYSQDLPYRHLVLLYGAQKFRKFIAEQNPILEISVSKAEQISCSQCKLTLEKMCFLSVADSQKQIYYCQECTEKKFAPFLCIPITKATEIPKIVKIKGCLIMTPSDESIPFYGYKCSKCQGKKQKQYFLCAECNEKWCQNCFEDSKNCMEIGHIVILETHPFSFWCEKMPENELNHLKFQNDLVIKNHHLFQQAQMYFESHKDEEAVRYYSAYIQRNEAKFQDHNVATCYNNIGLIYDNHEEHKKALECHLKSLDIRKSIFGDNHPDIATSFNNLGLVYDHQGEHLKALEYHVKSLDIRKLVYGENHLSVAASSNNIGSIYFTRGEYNKALEYFLKSLSIQKSVFGYNHPDIAISYNNIGSGYQKQGEHKKALDCLLKSLEINKTVYGENHPQVATSYGNIGTLYFEEEESQKALECHLKSLDIRKSVFGENHRNVALSYSHLGNVSESQGKLIDALKYYVESLNIYNRIYGEKHPSTLNILKRIFKLNSVSQKE